MTPTKHSAMDYSRWDNINVSDDDEEDDAPITPPRRPPPVVLDDLEDYFLRLEERRTASGGAPSVVDVPRLSDEELEALPARPWLQGAGGECAICLAELDSGGEARTLVCGHAFHAACINEWLSKDGRCPVCRPRPTTGLWPTPSGFGYRLAD